MRIKRAYCATCNASAGSCEHHYNGKVKCTTCGDIYTAETNTLGGSLFCWNCVQTKKALEGYSL